MSVEQIKAFRKAVNDSRDLQEKILGGVSMFEVAKSLGFTFSRSEYTAFMEKESGGELTEFELEMVAGGRVDLLLGDYVDLSGCF